MGSKHINKYSQINRLNTHKNKLLVWKEALLVIVNKLFCGIIDLQKQKIEIEQNEVQIKSHHRESRVLVHNLIKATVYVMGYPIKYEKKKRI